MDPPAYTAPMRRFWLIGTLAYAGGFGVACGDTGVSAIALGMRAPQGLLDDATSVELQVIANDNVTCNPANGRISGTFREGDLQTFALERGACAPGATWCKDITLERDGERRLFNVVATTAGSILARGCGEAVIDQDPVEVALTVRPEIEDRCCNDGRVQVGEQCDTGVAADTNCAGDPVDASSGSCGGIVTDQVCECDCLAREIPLSAAGQSPPLDNAPNTKGDVAIAFAGPAGADIPGSLRAVFTDSSPAAAATVPDINYRVLRRDLYSPVGPLAQQLRLPRTCVGNLLIDADGLQREQFDPDIARVSDERMFVVWADDFTQPGSHDIRGSTVNEVGCSDQDVPTTINAGKSNPLRNPSVAGGPSGTALAVWADGGAVKGRIYDVNTGELTPPSADIDIATGVDGVRPVVAGNANGWVVAYEGPSNGGDVFVKRIGTDGLPGGEVRVNVVTNGRQQAPGIALLPDGRYAVAWQDGGTIRFQRYAADDSAISGDQDEPASVGSPPGAAPAVAASIDGGSFFVLAWSTDEGSVWSRLVDAGVEGRFLRNNVDGLLGDFLASHPAIPGERVAVDVSVGAEFIAYAWVDPAAGVVTRRFPRPAQ